MRKPVFQVLLHLTDKPGVDGERLIETIRLIGAQGSTPQLVAGEIDMRKNIARQPNAWHIGVRMMKPNASAMYWP